MGILNLGFKPKSETPPSEPAEEMPESGAEILDVGSIMGEGAANAEPEPGSEDLAQAQEQIPSPGFPVQGEEVRRKRGRPRKVETPPNELELFFSKDGIGQIWVNGWNAFYSLCNAPALSPEETEMHKRVFAAWCKARMPAEASKYQPDILLVATIAMSTLPRINPIAQTTVPLWRRLFNRLRGKSNE